MDISKMVIGKGQDHCYWVYDDATDKYLHTDISWGEYSEDEFIRMMARCGEAHGYGWSNALHD